MERPLPGQAPFVGRSEQLGRLIALAHTLRGEQHGWLATISGGAGVGKSRLVTEFAAAARRDDVAVLFGFCDDESPQNPYAAVIDAIRSGLRDAPLERRTTIVDDLGVLADVLLPDIQAGRGVGSPDRTVIADAVLRALRGFAHPSGVVLIIEDLHTATRATTSLLRYLARRIDGERAGIVVTWRSDESDTTLHAFETDLHARSSLGARVELPPLTWAETREFVRALLDASALPPTAFIDQLYERTEGNAFYIEELVHALGPPPADGRVEIARRLPDTLAGVLRERLSRLSKPARRVLGAGAVFGRRFTADALISIAGMDAAMVERGLGEAVNQNLIVEEGDLFSFRHALLQEAAMADLLPSERRRLHLRIAHGLERDASRSHSDVSPALAYHYGRAGDHESERLYAERAGDEALSRGAMREAANWFTDALRLSGELDEQAPVPLLEKCARVFMSSWRLAEATEAYDRLIAARREAGDPAALGETIALSAMTFFNEPQHRLARLHEALEILEPLGPSVALARAKAGVAGLYLSLDHPDAFEAGVAARRMARETGTEDAEATALRVLGTVAAHGDIALGARVLRDAIRIAMKQGRNDEAYITSFNLSGAYLRTGRWEDAERALSASYDGAVRENVPDAIGTSIIRVAEISRQRGDWQRADALVNEALIRIDVTDVSARMLAAFERAYLDAARGRWQPVIDAVQPMTASIDDKDQKIDVIVAHHLLARAYDGLGEHEEALRHADVVLAALRCCGDHYAGLPFYELDCVLYAAAGRLTDARAIVADVEDLQRRVRLALDPERMHMLLDNQYRRSAGDEVRPGDDLHAMADAVIASCGAIVAEAEGRFGDAANGLERALAFWVGAGRPYEEARYRVRLASALLLQADPTDRDVAREHLLTARAELERLGAVELATADGLLRKYRLVAPPSRRAPGHLSQREHEIAELVAAGLSNRKIAEELVLSPRTVEHHVSRILGKLQLPSRSALAAHVAASADHPD